MDYMTITWVTYNNLTAIQKSWLIGVSHVDSINTVRTSIDGLSFILKYDSSQSLGDVLEIPHTKFTHSQMLVEVASERWVSTGEI